MRMSCNRSMHSHLGDDHPTAVTCSGRSTTSSSILCWAGLLGGLWHLLIQVIHHQVLRLQQEQQQLAAQDLTCFRGTWHNL